MLYRDRLHINMTRSCFMIAFRYLLLPRALEIFFVGGRSVFLRFKTTQLCDTFMVEVSQRYWNCSLFIFVGCDVIARNVGGVADH